MESSFYYFFSATSQVLGGILALFGVFVIFKIKTLKDELLGIGQSLYDKADYAVRQKYAKLSENQSSTGILDRIKLSIDIKNIKELKEPINSIDNPECLALLNKLYGNFLIQRNRYNEIYQFHKKLILQTILWSIYTATVIIISLIILSEGDYFLNHVCLLSYTFWTIICLIFVCFSGLIYILIRSLSEL